MASETNSSQKKGIPSWVWVVSPLVIVVVVFGYLRLFSPSVLADFAKCLTEKKAVFYGMYDCPHCLTQKRDFGRAMEFINYVECKMPNGTWADVCKQENITATPTWKFDGKDPVTGRQSLQYLAEKTGCPLPEGVEQTGKVANNLTTEGQTQVTIQPTASPTK
ncbi:MAG: hypothetical protein HY817_01195 [Candidatus Abawacabacteria bacterium]|nr:hypothetical protein [Candidatus Abawacabacteria bacterium]